MSHKRKMHIKGPRWYAEEDRMRRQIKNSLGQGETRTTDDSGESGQAICSPRAAVLCSDCGTACVLVDGSWLCPVHPGCRSLPGGIR